MNHPEILTKENFWNQVYEISHGEMEHFCQWVDEYKKRVGWAGLFRSEYGRGTAPKFHDLPIAMQLGIFYQYLQETDREPELFDTNPTNFVAVMQSISDYFIMKHDDGKNEKAQAYEPPIIDYSHVDHFDS